MPRKFIYWGLYALFLLSLVVACELMSRLVIPISPGIKKISASGEELSISWNAPNKSYTHVSAEFSKKTTTDRHGYRITRHAGTSGPVVLFLGDSFTYGLGVSDDETIPLLTCRKLAVRCVNLGVPGSGMILQQKQLRDHLKNVGDRPVVLVHLLFASSSHAHIGNDIVDTINENKSADKTAAAVNQTPAGPLLLFARWLGRNSNLFRIVRFHFGNSLRSMAFSDESSWHDKPEVGVFYDKLREIRDEARARKIIYLPILVSSYSEIVSNLQSRTAADISKRTGIRVGVPDYSGADIEKLFYPLDGHYSAAGARFMSEFTARILSERLPG